MRRGAPWSVQHARQPISACNHVGGRGQSPHIKLMLLRGLSPSRRTRPHSCPPAGHAVVCFCVKRNPFTSNPASILRTAPRGPTLQGRSGSHQRSGRRRPSILVPELPSPPRSTAQSISCDRTRTRKSALPHALQTRSLRSEPTRWATIPTRLGSAQPGLIGT